MILYFGCYTWTLSFELLVLHCVAQCPLSSAKLPAGSTLFPAKPINCLSESVEELPICTANHNPTSHLLELCWALQGCSWPWQMLPVLSMWPWSSLPFHKHDTHFRSGLQSCTALTVPATCHRGHRECKRKQRYTEKASPKLHSRLKPASLDTMEGFTARVS